MLAQLFFNVPTSPYYEIQVKGLQYLVQIHHFKSIKIKPGSSANLVDFGKDCLRKYGLDFVFLSEKQVLSDNLLITGIYHALKDQYEYSLQASTNFPMNVLMHVFCTSQAHIIKEEITQGLLSNENVEYLDLVIICIGESMMREYFSKVLEDLKAMFLVENATREDDSLILNNNRLLSANQQPAFKSKYPGEKSGFSIDWGKKVAKSRMALYSLSLQTKI